MEYVNSYIFILVTIILFILLIIFLWNFKQKKILALKIPFLEDLIKAQKKSQKLTLEKGFKYLQYFALTCSIIFLTVALARPQSFSQEEKISKNGVDILIALDVSESMLAEDLQPNRMEAAKKYIDEFVSKLKNDRIGLNVFAGKPFTQSPLSFDYNVIRYYLSQISTDTIDQQRRGLGGTAIGDSIVSAINRFQDDKDRTKVLILLTDGEANVGVDPIFAAEHARSKGIKIYTIGLGQKDGAPLKIKDAFGQETYATNPDGSIYKTKFDEKTLKDIAQVSGGEYFYAGNNNSLKKSFESINALEKTKHEAEIIINHKDHFWKWLVWSFWSALLAIPILFRKKSQENDIIFQRNKNTPTWHYVWHLKFISLGLAFVFLLIAIWRPQWGNELQKNSKKGLDIIFTVDVSKSMQALDFSQKNQLISRLDATKYLIGTFSEKRKSDRIGLVEFAGESFVASPLTLDHSVFHNFLKNISSNDLGKQGTNLSEALEISLARLQIASEKERGKAIILFSDGDETISSNAIKIADLAKEKGIKIFTVGIGSEKGMPIPEGQDAFGKIIYKKWKNKTVLTALNPTPLKKIANITNGEYFHAENINDLDNLLLNLNKLPKKILEEENLTPESEKYFPFAALALILFIISYAYPIYPFLKRKT